MATDPLDKERIDRLEKLADQRSATSTSLEPWQEQLSRQTTVAGSKALQAAEVIAGLSGGWAAFYDLGTSSSTEGGIIGTPTPQAKNTKLGQPGLPEINFVPYNWGTNKFGSKGPSLLGHPIAMSIVGPTVKSPINDWQWIVTDNSSSPGVGDDLTLDSAAGIYSSIGVDVAPVCGTVVEAFNAADPADFNGGLYLVISQSGENGAAPTPDSGLGDGFVATGTVTAEAITPLNKTSNFEIFRVESIAGDTITLDPNKRLATYFSITAGPNTPYARAITLFQPHATRLVAVPGSGGVGAERAFVVVPPERAAVGEHLPPYDGLSASDGTWIRGGYDPLSPTQGGHPTLYLDGPLLPVPRPRARLRGRAQRVSTGISSTTFIGGTWWLEADGHTPSTSDIGSIVRIYRTEREGDADFLLPGAASGKPAAPESAMLGWFEILDVDLGAPGDRYQLRRIIEVDPLTGVPYFGSGGTLQLQDTLGPVGDVRVEFTLHDSVSGFHASIFSDPDKLASMRLTNLIDPLWVQRSAKNLGLTEGSLPHAPDRAIWDTSKDGTEAADPGSLLDLGFRMVLFAAKEGVGSFAGQIVPDWDNPITSREVVLDPSNTTEVQHLNIDYSSGVVTLSHTPVPGAGCDIAPNGIISSDNPRGEIVLFAACVPYSMEKGQLGPSVRATAALPVDSDAATAGVVPPQTDVYGSRTSRSVSPTVNTSGAAQIIDSGVGLVIDLFDIASDFPDSGFFELRVDNVYGAPAHVGPASEPLGLYGYYKKTELVDPARGGVTHTRLEGVYGGGSYGVDSIDASLTGLVAVLRRDIQTPVSPDGIAGTFYEHDISYGFAKRAESFRFANASLQPQPDGSVVVQPEVGFATSIGDKIHEWAFSSKVLDGAVMSVGVGTTIDLTAVTVLITGVCTILPADSIVLPGVDDFYYIYLDGTVPALPVYAHTTSLPLPSVEDALVGLVEVTGGGTAVSVITDLRYPLNDINLRDPILVGVVEHGGMMPHFTNLADAVAYLGETMDPTDGDNGQSRRILVVGHTDEDSSKLPIVMPADGIVIEGASRRMDGGAAPPNSPTQIRWDSDGPLFDLNGKNDLVFRNLPILYKAGAGVLDAFPGRIVFDNTGGDICRRCVIENLHVTTADLRLHGFMHMVGASNGMEDSVIRDNNIVTTDFGIFVNTTASEFDNNIIQGNRLTNVGAQQGVTFGLFDGISVLGAGTDDNNQYVDNLSTGFERAFYLTGSYPQLVRNRISATREVAIQIAGTGVSAAVIRDNVLTSVHTAAPSLPERRAIWIETGTGNVVADNHIDMDIGLAADRAIFTSTADNIVRGNRVENSIEVSSTNQVSENQVSENVVTAANSRVHGNKIDGTLATGSDCEVTGNVVTGAVTFQADTIVSDNDFSSDATGLSARVHWHNNRIGGDLDSSADSEITGNNVIGAYLGAGATGCIIADNRIGGAATLDDNCEVTGNKIAGVLTGSAACVITSNEVDSITATLQDNAIVSDNLLTFSGAGNALLWTGVDCTFVNNRVTGTTSDYDFTGTNLQVTGNAGRHMVVSASDAIVMGNRLSGGLGVAGDRMRVTNNILRGVQTIFTGTGALVVDSGTYMTISENVIVTSPAADGDFLLGLGGDHTYLTVANNYISGDLLCNTGNWVASSSFTGNTISGELDFSGIILFHANAFTGNSISGDFEVQGNDNTIDGNNVDGMMDFRGDDNIISDNSEAATITLGVGAANCILTGNRGGAIDTSLSDGGHNISDNQLRVPGTGFINAGSTHDNVIADNILVGGITVLAGGLRNHVTGNTCAQLFGGGGTDGVIADNRFTSTTDPHLFPNDRNVVTGNYFPATTDGSGIVWGGDECRYTGNVIQDPSTAVLLVSWEGNENTFSGNAFNNGSPTSTTIDLTGFNHSITGNRVTGFTGVDVNQATITGNVFEQDCTFDEDCVGLTITGNQFSSSGDLVFSTGGSPGGNHVVSDNFFATGFLDLGDHDNCVVKGNNVAPDAGTGAIKGTGSNHVVSDNKIVDGGGAPALINSIDLRGGSFHTISGNNIPDGWLLVDAASESILIGNRTRGIGTSAVGAGAVAGAGIVGVGNKVGVAGTAPTGLYFTINKGTGPVDTGNVE